MPEDWVGWDPNVIGENLDLRMADYSLDSAGSELGAFALLILGTIFILLNQVDGKIFRLRIFLMNRDFDLIKDEGLIKFVNVMLTILSWISICMPVLAIAVWAAGLIERSLDFNEIPIGGVCVALAGASFVLFTFGVLKIKWNNFRFSFINGFCIFLAFCGLTTYQFVVIFLDDSTNNFFGFSTVFFSINGLFNIIIMFLNSGIDSGTMKHILMNNMEKGQVRDPHRDDDFLEEINEERANQKYFPTYQDVLDLFTIGITEQEETSELASSLGGGIQTAIKELNIHLQRTISLILWAVSTGILVVYAYVVYWKFEHSIIGFINLIAIVGTDIFLYFVWSSEVIKHHSILTLAIFLNRLMLICFGGNYWIYGYFILYMIYGVFLSHIICKKRFPFEDAFGDINLNSLNKKVNKEDISKSPEFLLLLLTMMYMIFIVALVIIEPSNIPLPHFEIDGWTYPFYTIALYCLLLIVNFFSLLGTYRLFFRKKKKIEPQIFFYIKSLRFDMYWIFITCSLLTLSFIGLISFYLTDLVIYFLMIIFISIFIIAYLNAYLHYNMNDFDMFQNVKQINSNVEKHNIRLIELRKKVSQIKKDIDEGKATAIAAESLGLAKNIMQQNRYKKKIENMNKRIEIENIKLKSMKTNNLGKSMKSSGPPRLSLMKGASSKLQSALGRVSPDRNAEVSVKVQQINHTRVVPSQNITMQPMNEDKNKNGLLSPQVNNDDENLINEEMKNIQKDEIYEGGEEEPALDLRQVKSHLEDFDKELDDEVKEDIESSDEEIDLDKNFDVGDELRLKRRLKKVYDWRTEHSWLGAFFLCKLRRNDYQIMFSLLVAHVAIVAMAISVSILDESVLGITIAVPLVHYTLAAFSLAKAMSTDAKLTCMEYFFFGCAYAIQYGWGIANIFISFTSEDIDPSIEGAADAGTYFVVYLMVIPFITSVTSAILKWIDDKGQITFFFVLQMMLTVLQGVGMLVLAYVYMTYEEGIIVSVIIGVLCYIVLQMYIYAKNDYEMPIAWATINIVIVAGIIIASTVVSLIVEEFEVFFGVSISIWVFAGLLLVYAISEITSDLNHMETKPVYYSPWVFPVYVYNPKKNDVEANNGPCAALVIGIMILISWAVIASIWVFPHNAGVSLSILFEYILVFCLFHLMQASSLQLKSIIKDIDKMLIRSAWLDAKLGYINNRQAFSRDALDTFEKIRLQRDYFRNYMRLKEGRETLNLEERSEHVKFYEEDEINIDWVDENKVDLQNNIACYSFLFDLELEMKRIYQEEIELMIQFQLLIVLQAENLSQQRRKYLFTFLQEKKAALIALGIVIYVPDHGNMAIRYARVITQIQKLSPEKQTMFNHLRDQFINEERVKEEQVKEASRLEEEKERQRQELLEQMAKKKKKLKKEFNYDMPVDDMPDCKSKYMKILDEAQAGKLFNDAQFKPNDDSLGPNCLNRGVAKWVRARDKPQCKIFKDKINHQDVVQGALGDCYFLSAISVLGEKFVRKIILTTEEEWRLSGAFHVQFYRDGEPEDIIIDDFFPAYGNDDWVFVRGNEEGDELWPMILEKAYAKMYGTFNYIEAGKVQYALSDMTDGFPEQIDLKVEGQNVDSLWEKIKVLGRHGSLMGAGSPEHSMGDKAISEMGIVQGHAYSILSIQEVDGFRLLQLRNPHGSKGVEWSGDWSDTSEKWDQRMRNKVGYHDQSNDGVFWMDCHDFVQQYSFLYICRLLDEEDGWVEQKIRGEWKGASAEGLPSRANPNARLDFNPQFEITVTRPADGFISLTQFTNRINMFKGKNSIFFMVSKVGGKHITKVDKASLLVKSGNPINLNIITSECDFDKSVKYPYKFTLMVANTDNGPKGEGEFEIALYSTDKNIQIKAMDPPKDFPK